MNDWQTPEQFEATEQRLRWEIHRLRDAVADANENARTYRRMYEEAVRYVGIFHPMLAEIVEEDAFRLWEMDVR